MNSTGFLDWECPSRISGARQLQHIPIDTFDDIFSWLRPEVDTDMDPDMYYVTLARLAPVCRYFLFFVVREFSGSLYFNGHWQPHLKELTPTDTWCHGIVHKQQPMETYRSEVKACTMHDWMETHWQIRDEGICYIFPKFLELFPRVLDRLDALSTLKLRHMPISLDLYRTIGRLQSLEELEIGGCRVEEMHSPYSAPFSTDEKPFPRLRQLLLLDVILHPAHLGAIGKLFIGLASAPTLRLLALSNHCWIPLMFPHLSLGLRSLTVNLMSYNINLLLAYLNLNVNLEHLAIYSRDVITGDLAEDAYLPSSAYRTDVARLKESLPSFKQLKHNALPGLKSFSGPSWLAPVFVRGRPISRVALGCHLPSKTHDNYLLTRYGIDIFKSSHMLDSPTSWGSGGHGDTDLILSSLSNIQGEGLRDLFIDLPDRMDLTILFLHLPNLVRLQLDFRQEGVRMESRQETWISSLTKAFQKSRRLDTLILCALSYQPLAYKLSPGHQYDLVKAWKASCPTLKTVVFGPYMVWHWRRTDVPSMAFLTESQAELGPSVTSGHHTTSPSTTLPPKPIHNRWELELLSVRLLRGKLYEWAQEYDRDPVLDWNGKIEGIFDAEPAEGHLRPHRPFTASGHQFWEFDVRSLGVNKGPGMNRIPMRAGESLPPQRPIVFREFGTPSRDVQDGTSTIYRTV